MTQSIEPELAKLAKALGFYYDKEDKCWYADYVEGEKLYPDEQMKRLKPIVATLIKSRALEARIDELKISISVAKSYEKNYPQRISMILESHLAKLKKLAQLKHERSE